MTANKQITRISLFLIAIFLSVGAIAQTGSFNNVQIRNNLRLKGKTIYQFSNDSAFVLADSGSLPTAWAVKAFLLNRLGNLTIATGNTYVVNSQSGMLALNATVGDVAVRSDSSKSYILRTLPANDFSNWVLLLFPNNVPSVFGRSGPVVAEAGDYDITQISGVPAWLTKIHAGYGMKNVNDSSLMADTALIASTLNVKNAKDSLGNILDGTLYYINQLTDNSFSITKRNGDSTVIEFSGTINSSNNVTPQQLSDTAQSIRTDLARPYKVYSALLSQTGTSAPTATVLENTLGIPVTFTYVSVGRYRANITSTLFAPNKTFVVMQNTPYVNINYTEAAVASASNYIDIWVRNPTTSSNVDGLYNASFEIRVYN